jgi:O-antigen/teichoic acid export membrane protein
MNNSHRAIFINVLWLIFDKIFILLVGLFVIVRIANHYGKTVYGLYEYALSIISIISIILLLADSRVIKKLYKNERHNDENIVFNTSFLKFLLALIVFVISIGILVIIGMETTFNVVFLLLLLNVLLLNLGFGILNFFEYNLKSRNVVLASNIAIFVVSILQLLAITLDYPIEVIVMLIVLGSLIRLIILVMLYKLVFRYNIFTKINFNIIKEILHRSIPLAIAAAASLIYQKVDQVMIGSIISIDSVGIYAISSKMIAVVSIIIVPIQVSVYPKMLEWYKRDKDLYYKRYSQITSFTIWIYIVGTIIIYCIGDEIFFYLFSSEYIQSFDIFKIHIIGVFFAYIAILRSSHYTIINKATIMTLTQVIAMIINIIFNYLLLNHIGVIGAAISTAFTQSLSLLLLDRFFTEGKKIFEININSLNPIIIMKFLLEEYKKYKKRRN